LPAGTQTLRVDIAANDNYNAASATAEVTVAKAPLDVAVWTNGRYYYDPPRIYPADEVFGAMQGDFFNISFSTTAGANAPAGAYQLVPIFNDPGNVLRNYAINYANLAFTVYNPPIVLTDVQPLSAVRGSGNVTIVLRAAECAPFDPTLCSFGFVPESSVKWNSTSVATTFVSRTELRAVVPASFLTTHGVAYLTVGSPDPFAGGPVVKEFFITDAPTAVTTAATGSSAGDGPLMLETGSMGESEPNTLFIESDATGVGTVTIATYATNPAAAFAGADHFFDVFVAPGNTFTALTIRTCNVGSARQVFWHAATGWQPASHQVFSDATAESPACITVTVNNVDTSPAIADLSGTYFGVSNAPPVAPPDGRMFGRGHVNDGRLHHHFVFRALQRGSLDTARLEYWARTLKSGRHEDDIDDDAYSAETGGEPDSSYRRGRRVATNTFEATRIDSVAFLDDPGFKPHRGKDKRPPSVDTVTITGAGNWKGLAGYTFEARATDQGEPGRHRDLFSIVIKDARGIVVASVSSELDGGNVQSTRLRK
jgi:hypothetical protein